MRRFERAHVTEDDPGLPPLAELLDLIEERDAELGAHSRRVGAYAEAIAREMGLPAPVIDRVRTAARLHDLGKLYVPRHILDKPGPLTEDEWAEIQKHPGTAARLLRIAELHDLAALVIAHHERPDGRGYPRGVRSTQAPIEAQIVAVADVYDAMLTPRPYGPTRTPAGAREELVRVSATQLDAHVVAAFLRVLDRAGAGADAVSA